MLGVLVEDAPNCVLLATSSFLSGSSQDKKAQMNKLLMAVVKNIMDKGKHAMDIITEDNRVLKRKIEELTAASQAPFKLPYYWDGDHASSNRPLLRDAYLPEGHNQHLAENMLNDCINPKCNENMRNGDPLRSICAQHLNYDRGLQMTCPFRIIKMERLENSEAFQRFQMHEAIVTRAMEKLPQRELDQVMSQRQSSSSGWLQKLEMKNDLKQMANTRYLLHGTKQEHLSDIIKKGLRAGFARDTSACIYGKGIYFADTSCKANQYTDNNNTSEKLILICRVVLGRSKLLPGCDREMRNAPEGYHSCHVNELTLNNANIPQVHNEYIVYNDIECYPEFLLRCKIDWHDP
uniref:Poly [ADP-ribose] polymerase n=1 Tax=Octactis speculum TaxID=3111310 RepID=A0A7S2ALM1_9STRA